MINAIKEFLKEFTKDMRIIFTDESDGHVVHLVQRYAAGETHLKNMAIRYYRRGFLKKGSVYHLFMSEVDNDYPDIGLRNKYRRQVLATIPSAKRPWVVDRDGVCKTDSQTRKVVLKGREP